MTEPNNHTLTDNQNEQTLTFLRNEIDSLKFQLKKKEDRIADLDAFVKIEQCSGISSVLSQVTQQIFHRIKILILAFCQIRFTCPLADLPGL